MANNISIKDGAAASKVLKTTDNTSVHTPHHNIDTIATGASADLDTANATLSSIDTTLLANLPAPSQAAMADSLPVAIASDQTPLTITGTVLNGGTSWIQVFAVTSEADLTSLTDITAAPDSGEHIVVESVAISAAVAMVVTLTEQTSGTIVKVFNLTLTDLNAEWNPNYGLRLPTADKKLQATSDTIGQVDLTVVSHSAV